MKTSRANIGIIGTGAVGQFLGAALSGDANVLWFSRSAKITPEEIRITGFRDWSVPGPRIVATQAGMRSSLIQKLDACFVAVREDQLSSVFPLLGAFSPKLPIVLVQNGLGILGRIASGGITQPDRLLRMLCRFGVVKEGEWSTRLSGSFGATLAPAGTLAEEIGKILRSAGFDISSATSVLDAEWQKAVINLFVNPLCTLQGRSNAAVIEDPDLRAEAVALVSEAIAVAQCEGIDLSHWTEERLVEGVGPFRSNTNSDLVGVRFGIRPLMDSLLGEITRRAAKYGVPVPGIADVQRRLTEQFAAL